MNNSREILPEKERISAFDFEIRDLNGDLYPDESQMYRYHKALEAAESEISKLEELLTIAVTSSLEHHKDLCTKYAELSWNIETLANSRDSENGISNSLFRELVRELINKDADERYNKALDTYYSNKIEEGVNASDISHKRLIKALKIAAYGNNI